jgi:hypothetical protein
MIPYKFIDIPNFAQIQQQLILLVPGIFNEIKTSAFIVASDVVLSVCPLLENFLKQNSLEWDIARFFMTGPYDSLPIHIDGNNEYPKFLALNLPITGCDSSAMNWWTQAEVAGVVSDSKYYGTGLTIFESSSEPTYSCALTGPALVQINLPHNVINMQKNERIVLSIRFRPEPLHLWHR